MMQLIDDKRWVPWIDFACDYRLSAHERLLARKHTHTHLTEVDSVMPVRSVCASVSTSTATDTFNESRRTTLSAVAVAASSTRLPLNSMIAGCINMPVHMRA
jgi:hypothetical protein